MKYLEYQFTAIDLDSRDEITDVFLIKTPTTKDIFDIAQQYIDTRHELTTLTGNTWEIDDVVPTGLETVRVEGRHIVVRDRDIEFKEVKYPIATL